MDSLKKELTIADFKKNFTAVKSEYRPVPFCHLDGDISDDEYINTLITGYKKSGYGGLALLPVRETLPEYGTDEYYEAYGRLLERLKKAGMSAIYYDDRDFPTGWAGGELAEKYPQLLAKQLRRYELACTEGEHARYRLRMSGATMSLVAYQEDTSEVIDLRDHIKGEYLEWDTPEGNWTIHQYCCEYAEDEKYVNYLDYDACRAFISLSYKRFTDRFEEYIGDTVTMTFYDDIQLRTRNRRMWDNNFNAVFEEKYGYDPAPYYPALYGDISDNSQHYRAALMDCRAEMLTEGFFRAVSDFTNAHGLICTGHVAEPKTSAAPWLYGDGMKYQKYAGAAGMDLVHRYMYGFNGLKMVSSAAYNYDLPTVVCEIFGNYKTLNEDIMYREAMNAFSRGVNYLIPHTLWLSGKARIPHEVSHRNPEFRDFLRDWNDYAARCQTLLRGGRHVCDVALLYPIYSLEAQSTLFEAPASGFEFPTTPSNADYMNVINTIMNYCGHDLTVLHPEVFNDKCHIDENILCLSNTINIEQYKVLVLPGSSIISVRSLRLIKKFFAAGGKLVATDELPHAAFEFNPDKNENGVSAYDIEVQQLVYEIFGVRREDVNAFEPYYYNRSEAGGEAYFLPASSTAADGTDLVDKQLLDSILNVKLKLAYDVEISDMPRIVNSGVLNLPLPMYINVDRSGSAGGVFNYIHRKTAGCDFYFFANSTNSGYTGRVALRGKFTLCEEWNPHTGKIKKLSFEYGFENGEDYTSVELDIPSAHSTFVVARTQTAWFD